MDNEMKKEPNLFIKKLNSKEMFVKAGLDFVNNENLKWSTRAIFLYILSKPNEWNINVTDIINHSKEGKTIVRNAIIELIQQGYLYRIQKKTQGVIKAWGYIACANNNNDPESINDFINENCEDWFLLSKTPEVDDTTSGSTTSGSTTSRTTTCGRAERLVRYNNSKIKSSKIENSKIDVKPKGLTSAVVQDASASTGFAQPARKKLRQAFDQRQAKLNEPKPMPKNMIPIFALWYSSVLPEKSTGKHYTQLKSYERAIKLIRKAIKGTLFKDYEHDDELKHLFNQKITVEHILECINTHIVALSSDYHPIEKKFLRIHLSEFLLNKYSPSVKSYLCHWTFKDPVPVLKQIEMLHPSLTNSLLNELDWQDLPPEKQNPVIKFVNENYLQFKTWKVNPMYKTSKYDDTLAKIIVDCLKRKFEFNKNFEITSGLFMNKKIMSWINTMTETSKYLV